jgi:hypothetical protein
VSRDQDVPEGQKIITGGPFNLVAPDGTWIWNEGTPSDIPVIGKVRVLVLDPPQYERTWSAGRFFPGIPAGLTLVRTLTPDEVELWFEHVGAASENGVA